MGKRTRYSAEFKAKVAKEAMKGEETLAQLATRFGVHPNQVAQWKKQALDGLTEIFSSKAEEVSVSREAEIKDLHAKIGQLTIERDFLAKVIPLYTAPL